MELEKELRVTPWKSHEEWKVVQHYLLNKQLTLAKEHIEIWSARCHKLDAGIETTYCLLEAILLNTNEAAHALTLSASINRFLNLISHAGMNMFNMSKYYDVAKYLGIPRWIVDVRHDFSHGQMPSYEVLKSAVSFCFKWLLINYWHFEDESCEKLKNVRHFGCYEYVHDLLDCYKYLKIYALWGNRKLKEIRDQKEIHDQLFKFISDMRSNNGGEPKRKKKKTRNDEDDIDINNSAVILRNQVEKMIKSKDSFEMKALIVTLCQDELLVPDEDLVKSLTEKKDDPFLPQNLVKIWSDILSMISQSGYMPDLLQTLLESSFGSAFSHSVAQAWLSMILSQLCNKNGALKLNSVKNDQEKWNEFVSNYVLSRDQSLSKNIDLLKNIQDPPLNKEQISKIKKLLEIFQEDSGFEECQEVKSVQDIPKKKEGNIWTKIPNYEMCLGEIDSFQGIEGKPDSPYWLEYSDEEPMALNWHFLMQKFNKL